MKGYAIEWNNWEVGCGGRDGDAVDNFLGRFGFGRRKVYGLSV